MTEKERGELNAFPLVTKTETTTEVQYGLSLREYFAGLAMQGIVHLYQKGATGAQWDNAGILARNSVRCADALIAELNKEE